MVAAGEEALLVLDRGKEIVVAAVLGSDRVVAPSPGEADDDEGGGERTSAALQYAGESAYGFVRNSIGRDVIGSHDFQKFVPYLVAIFFFLLVNNAFASIPAIQFPTFSRASMAYALAALSWIIYNAVGIHKHGLVGYFKLQSVPSGVSPVMYPLLVPLEFFSNILVRPATLALRLFANMFAGHLLLILFSTGGLFLIEYGGIGYVAGPLAWVLAIAISFLELLVQFLQAYVFTLLNAMYISGALADEH